MRNENGNSSDIISHNKVSNILWFIFYSIMKENAASFGLVLSANWFGDQYKLIEKQMEKGKWRKRTYKKMILCLV